MKLRIGPFFILALVVSIPLAYLHYSERLMRRSTAKSATAPAPFMVPLDPVAFVLERAESLKLTSRQRKDLEKMKTEWEREAAPLREALGRSSMALRRGLDEGKSPGEAQSADYRALSRSLSEARKRYWEKITKILTAGQLEIAKRPAVK
jgi:hypothetical protein